MMEEMTIRLAQPTDNEPVKAMIFEVLREYSVPIEPEGDDLDATEFGLNDSRIYLVAEIFGQAVGSAILTPSDEGAYKLSKLFLPTALRGKGLGRKLLDSAVDYARQAGAKEVYLRTRDTYTEAVKLYEKAGWTRSQARLPPPGPPVRYSISTSAPTLES